jgi:hypothetical protein
MFSVSPVHVRPFHACALTACLLRPPSLTVLLSFPSKRCRHDDYLYAIGGLGPPPPLREKGASDGVRNTMEVLPLPTDAIASRLEAVERALDDKVYEQGRQLVGLSLSPPPPLSLSLASPARTHR